MKLNALCVCVVASAVSMFVMSSRAGDLNPPAGAVAPTGKTLTEVEPRIAVSAENTPGDSESEFRIASPGSYYLTGNVETDKLFAIKIASDDVTLDLMGFTISGADVPQSRGVGAEFGGTANNLTVRNGVIRSFTLGVEARISGNGEGVPTDFASLRVEEMRIFTSTGVGIRGGDDMMVRNCTLVGGDGIVAFGSGALIERNLIETGGSRGIQVGSGALVTHNTIRITQSFSDGIEVQGNGSRIEENHVSGVSGRVGIRAVDGSTNLFVRNSVSSNITTPYSLPQGTSTFGPIVNMTGDLAAVANGDHPWANFIY